MSGMELLILWLALVGIGLATYLMRLSFIVALERLTLPPLTRRALRFVPLAALIALVTPELVPPNLAALDTNAVARLLAALLAALVAWRTRNVLLTILVGMLALWLLQVALAWFAGAVGG